MNVSELSERFEANEEVTPEVLKERGIIKRRYDELKILGDGEISGAVTVRAHRFSKSAVSKIEAAGGKAEVIGAPTQSDGESQA